MKSKHRAIMAAAVTSQAAFCLCGAETMLKHLRTLLHEIVGVRQDEDIECVHRMRVASRHLRSLLPLFAACLPRQEAKRWRKQLRRVTRALGAARDTDVQIVFVEQCLEACQDEQWRAGVERFILRLRQQRQALQPPLLDALDWLQTSHLARNMDGMLRHLAHAAQAHGSEAVDPQTYRYTQHAVLTQLSAVQEQAATIQGPENNTALHDLRIAVKRLRYTMQAFAPLYQGELRDPIRAARKLQEVLGEIHDCDVWLDELPQFLEAERVRTVAYFGSLEPFDLLVPGLQALQTQRQQDRAHYYQEFTTFWQKVQTQDGWEDLRRALAAPLVSLQAAAIEKELQQLEPHLRASPSAWRWHVATCLGQIPYGHLMTCADLATWTNATAGLRITASNVAWLRAHLSQQLDLETAVPLHRLAKTADVHSLRDAAEMKRYNDARRGAEGTLTHPVWWRPEQFPS